MFKTQKTGQPDTLFKTNHFQKQKFQTRLRPHLGLPGRDVRALVRHKLREREQLDRHDQPHEAERHRLLSDIVFNVVPNICQVVFDGSLVVSLEYALNGANTEIVIEPCQSGCEPTEFQASSDFNQIRKYKLKRTPGTEAALQQFYEQYVKNRLTDMHLKLVYNDNGINSQQFISKSKIREQLTPGVAEQTIIISFSVQL
ncbi:Hypothetical_protein [Hexamita inflata]|uniref:Hypothetical_protein n=1 Tax=Hexamita inflata TaxID=28002 RepID=A0ABP1HLP7_9EUKA